MLGTGFAPPLQGEQVALCEAFGDLDAPVLAVDIPSGVSGDDGRVDPVAVRADVTVTVGLPKLGLLLPPGRDFAGALRVVDIGFDPEVCARHAGPWELSSPAQYLAHAAAAAHLRPQDQRAARCWCSPVRGPTAARRTSPASARCAPASAC